MAENMIICCVVRTIAHLGEVGFGEWGGVRCHGELMLNRLQISSVTEYVTIKTPENKLRPLSIIKKSKAIPVTGYGGQ
jgi:hypothetical protein